MAIINIPIETKVREFDGKLWLAANLAKDGHKVSLGKKYRAGLNDELCPHLHITGGRDQPMYDRLAEEGMNIGWLDTEGGVFPSKEYYLEKFNPAVFANGKSSNMDKIFTWGSLQAEIIQNETKFPKEDIYVTGNPRFDLVHPELREIYTEPASKISQEFGQFILVNTNFTYANPYNKDRLEKKRKGYMNISKLNHKLSFQQHLLYQFVSAIKTLSKKCPNYNIVVRPHPSENHAFYTEQFSDIQSIFIKHTGDVRSWIYAADCVVHNGCTTGIEAAMLNTPVVAYEPDLPVTSYHSPLPNTVSASAHSLDELIDEVKKYLSASEPYQMSPEQVNELKKYFENADQLTVPKFVEAISKIEGLEDDRPSTGGGSIRRRFERWFKNQPIAPYIGQIADVVEYGRSSYEKRKFPGLSIEEIQSRLDDFEEQIGEMNIKVEKVNNFEDIYWLKEK